MNSKTNFKLESLRKTTLHQVDKSISAMMDEIRREFCNQSVQTQELSKSLQSSKASLMFSPTVDYFKTNSNTDNSKNSESTGTLPVSLKQNRSRRERSFVARESLLTTLLQIDHIRTVRHLFFIVYFIIVVNGILYEYFEEGR